MSKYVPAFGSRLSVHDAEVWGERLAYLSERGIVTADTVVEDARCEESTIHPYFEWDDAVAAAGFRRDQARYFIRSVHIIYTKDAEPTRAFINLRVTESENEEGNAETEDESLPQGYLQTATVLADSRLSRVFLEQIRRELVSWQRRYNHYCEIATASAHVQMAIEAITTQVAAS